MMFETEQDLVNEVTALIGSSSSKVPKAFRHKNQMILEEVNLGYGIADIVLTQCSEEIEKRDTFLKPPEIKILHIVRKTRNVTAESIVKRTGLSKSKVRGYLLSLEKLEFVRDTDGVISPWKPYINTVKKAIAIEAKLHNWKRALKQAYRYKWFSDKSYVCLPSDRTKSALSSLDMFVDMGVGLLEVSKKGGIRVLHNPKPQKPICKEMNVLLNERVLNQIHASL